MKTLKITGQYQLAIEPDNNRLRLIVQDGDKEWVCRKVSPKQLNAFLKSDEQHLFKGRLQLDKVGDDVMVSVRGEEIGLVSSTAISNLIY